MWKFSETHYHPNWEYTAQPIPPSDLLVHALNEYGGQGWDLAFIHEGVMYLKRPTGRIDERSKSERSQ
jgi:hypothetical protein